MRALIDTIVTVVIAFVSTNIDDLFVLMLFFAQVTATFRPRHIIIGQYLGFSALVAISAVGYFGTFVLPRVWIGLLGLVPIALGLRGLLRRAAEPPADPPAVPAAATGRSWLGAVLSPQTASVAAVTFANGGDNLGIYVPLFARGSVANLVVTVGVFLLLVAVWCSLGAALATHPTIAAVLDRYGHRIVPFVLIGLGVYILLDSGTLAWLDRGALEEVPTRAPQHASQMPGADRCGAAPHRAM